MRVKLFCGFLAVSGNELIERSLPMCEEHSAWFGDTTGTISDGPDAYDDTFKCRWKVDGMTQNGRKNICVRFRYDEKFNHFFDLTPFFKNRTARAFVQNLAH